MNIFNKLKFILKKPKVIIVTGNGRSCAKEAIFQVLNKHFQIEKEILLFESDLENLNDLKEFKFYVQKSRLPILVVTHIGDIPPDYDFFSGQREKTEEIRKLVKFLPAQTYLILNFDDETAREIKKETESNVLTFGFQKGADFQTTDVKLNSGTNFKINYNGNIVPIWLEKLFGKEQIYSALSAVAVGTILDLNLIEISQALKDYHSLPGRMRFVEGIKHSWILDNSESESTFSMIEAIEILGKISPPPNSGGGSAPRKIAVLGDIIGIEKYAIEAHTTVGERTAQNADLLFTFGARAKFIGETAKLKGMMLDRIFQFDTIDEGKLKIQEEIKEGDLILVAGSKEMKMREIIEEIKAK